MERVETDDGESCLGRIRTSQVRINTVLNTKKIAIHFNHDHLEVFQFL